MVSTNTVVQLIRFTSHESVELQNTFLTSSIRFTATGVESLPDEIQSTCPICVRLVRMIRLHSNHVSAFGPELPLREYRSETESTLRRTTS